MQSQSLPGLVRARAPLGPERSLADASRETCSCVWFLVPGVTLFQLA